MYFASENFPSVQLKVFEIWRVVLSPPALCTPFRVCSLNAIFGCSEGWPTFTGRGPSPGPPRLCRRVGENRCGVNGGSDWRPSRRRTPERCAEAPEAAAPFISPAASGRGISRYHGDWGRTTPDRHPLGERYLSAAIFFHCLSNHHAALLGE